MDKIIGVLYDNKLIVNIICVFCLFLLIKNLFKKGEKKAEKKQFFRVKNLLRASSLKCYHFLLHIPYLKDFLYNMRMNIVIHHAVDEEDASLIVSKNIFLTIIVWIVSFIVSIKYFNDIFLAIISCIFITTIFADHLKANYVRFLEGLVDTIGDIVHYYNAEQGNLDHTFNRLLQSETMLKRHFKKIFQCVKDADSSDTPKAVLQQYDKYSPSKYLRIICNYLYITYRYGDVNIDGASMFNKNMFTLQREINTEMDKQFRIQDEAFGQVYFIIAPLYFIPLAKEYLLKYFTFEGFEYIEQFIHSNIGYMVTLICAITSLICFYLYKKFMYYGDSLKNRHHKSWEMNVLKRFKRIRNLVHKFMPKDNKKQNKMRNLIIQSGSGESLLVFYFRKLTLAGGTFIVIVLFFIFNTWSSQKEVLNDLYQGLNKNLFDQVLLVQDQPENYKKTSIENDKKVIKYIHNALDVMDLSPEELKEEIEKFIRDNGVNYGAYSDLAVERISSKLNLLYHRSNRVIIFLNRGIIFLFTLAVTLLAYSIPNIELYLKVHLNKELMLYDETMGLYTVTILLVNHSATNTKTILEWLTNFSNIFYAPLRESLDNYSSKALHYLNQTIKYKPFNRLIESVILSYEGVEIRKAFAGIEQKQLFQEKARERNNSKVAKVKIWVINILSWVSLGVTIVLYMLIPMIIASLDMYKNLNLI